MSSSMTESALIQAAQAGDRGALGQLLMMQTDTLTRRLATKMPPSLQRMVAVDDILQQAFSDAFRDIARFEERGPGSFYAWLSTIAEHRLQNAIKSSRRHKRGGLLQQVDPARGAETSVRDLLRQVAGNVDTPSMEAGRGEALGALSVAIAELPADYREVIRLRFLEGRSIEETSQTMDRTPAAVRALADRAKKQLRETMGRLSRYMSAS